jgi:hypothetical protein
MFFIITTFSNIHLFKHLNLRRFIMTGTKEGAQKANETKKEEGSNNKQSNQGQGRGSNLSEEDRRRGGANSGGGEK